MCFVLGGLGLYFILLFLLFNNLRVHHRLWLRRDGGRRGRGCGKERRREGEVVGKGGKRVSGEKE